MRVLTYADYEGEPASWAERIHPLVQGNLQPAGVDLTVGRIGINVTSGDRVSFDTGGTMVVRPGDFVNIQTQEVVTLRETDLGLVFAKVTLARQGFTSFRSKIDPGFKGPLFLSFANNGHSVLELREGTPICMITIFVMAEDAGKVYSAHPSIGPQSRPRVTLSLEANTEDRKAYESAFSRAELQLFDLLPALRSRFDRLEETVNVTRRQIFVGFLTSTIPTVVFGLLVITLTVLALTVGPGDTAQSIADAVPALPIVLSTISLVLVVGVIMSLLWRARPQ